MNKIDPSLMGTKIVKDLQYASASAVSLLYHRNTHLTKTGI